MRADRATNPCAFVAAYNTLVGASWSDAWIRAGGFVMTLQPAFKLAIRCSTMALESLLSLELQCMSYRQTSILRKYEAMQVLGRIDFVDRRARSNA